MDQQILQYAIPIALAGVILCCLGVGCVLCCLLVHRRRKLKEFNETLNMREESEKTDTIIIDEETCLDRGDRQENHDEDVVGVHAWEYGLIYNVKNARLNN
jgi:hypothetical protein